MAAYFGKIDGLLAQAMKVDEKQPDQVRDIEGKIALLQIESDKLISSLFEGGDVISSMKAENEGKLGEYIGNITESRQPAKAAAAES